MSKRRGFTIIAGRPDLIDAWENLRDPPVDRVVGGASVYRKQCISTEHGFGKDAVERHLYAFFLELAFDSVYLVSEECSSPFDGSGMLVLSSHVQVYSFPC